ncbi:MAG: SCO family protein [Myxococcales bacterium]|nr:SCO family protein [Myxococcales bacterium]
MLHASPAARPRTFTHLALCLALVSLGACSKPEPPPELPHLGTLPSFALTTQRGAAFGEGDFVGKLTAVNFIFTSCPTICPVIVERTRSVQAALKAASPRARIVSFSVDPETDTPEVLAKFAAKHGADESVWTFVTGDAGTLGEAVVHGFKVAVGERTPRADGAYDILHASHFVLVDDKAEIRGYYPSDADGAARLVAAVAELEKTAKLEKTQGAR